MIFFPIIGTQLKLTSDWTFRLFGEYRNSAVVDALGYTNNTLPLGQGYNGKYDNVTFPAETILKVDRIYVRKGSQDFNTITFYVVSSPMDYLKGKKRLRFWAKVDDINNKMQAEVIE